MGKGGERIFEPSMDILKEKSLSGARGYETDSRSVNQPARWVRNTKIVRMNR
jgi:hypothetical protein